MSSIRRMVVVLPRAVGTEQAKDLAALDVEGHVNHGLGFAERFGDV